MCNSRELGRPPFGKGSLVLRFMLDTKHYFLGPGNMNEHADVMSRDIDPCVLCGMKARFGKQIDSSDAVFRVNSAPTKGYEKWAGSKTTLRLINSVGFAGKWVSKLASKFSFDCVQLVVSY